MNNLLKKAFLLVLISGFGYFTQAQGFEPGNGFKQVNFGVGVSTWGVPVYAGMDFGVSDKITIGPRVSYRRYGENYNFGGTRYSYHYSIFNLSFRGDYHFSGHLVDIPEELDLYGGLSLGYSIWGNNFDGQGDFNGESSQVYLAIQAGARWYFHNNWGVNVEASGGSLSGLDIGLSYRF